MFQQFDFSLLLFICVFMFSVNITNNFFSFSLKEIILNLASKLNLEAKFSMISFNLFSVMFCILLLNLVSLVPYSFSASSHIWFSSLFAISFYLTAVISFFILKLVNFFAHFIPSGCPLWMSSFLFFVELLSSAVRPFTLILRLCANLTAGHVMLCLVGSFFMVLLLKSNYMFVVMFVFGMLFFLLEFAVCFIQALVFGLLLENYFDEI